MRSAMFVVAILTIAWSALAQEGKLTLSSAAPGNIFLAGEPLEFALAGPGAPQATFAVRDYDGHEVSSGQSRPKGDGAAVALPALGPGYYELTCRAEGAEVTASFGVLRSREGPPAQDWPLAVDGATAWLARPHQWQPLAEMLRRAGIGWVRERLSWGEVNPQPDKLDWGKYDTVAETFSAAGIRVYQIFHDSPGWTHPKGKHTRCPDDLREVYKFTKAAGAHFKGEIFAWEPWNEPDIGFFPDLGDRYAAVQKAAYLGFRAGGAEAPVLLCSLCRGHSAFSDNIFEAGVADYFEIFNFHTYSPLARYVQTIEGWMKLTRDYGVGDRPVWLTEAGIRLPGKPKLLSAEDQRKQAEFVPRSFAISLAGGVDHHFFFVYPNYLERGVQFGSLHPDLTPYPGFIAIATAVQTLRQGRYLGRLEVPEGASAYVFHTGEQRVAVVWSDKPQKVKLPVAAQEVTIRDLVGRDRAARAAGGVVELEAGPAAQYVLGLGSAVESKLIGSVRPPGKLPHLAPPKVVLAGRLDGPPLEKNANCYHVGGGERVLLVVDVYNFDEQHSATGRLRLELPGRKTVTIELAAGPYAPALQKLWVRGSFEGREVAPSVSYVKFDLSHTEALKSEPLGVERPEAWRKNISANGKMEIAPGPDGGVAFDISFHGPGDRWCYPDIALAQAADWREWEGVSFDYRFDTADKGTVVRFQVTEQGGPAYMTGPGFPAGKEWKRAVALFPELVWGSFSRKDENGRLDLDRIVGWRIGCNTKLDRLRLEVRDVKLVRFR